MKHAWTAALLALAASSAALAQDPPAKAPAAPPPKDGVEVKLAAKPETVVRFRLTLFVGVEVGGKVAKREEESRDYTVRVKSAQPDGGLDVEVTVDVIRVKALQRGTDQLLELDTSKPAPEGRDQKAALMDDVTRAMTGRAFTVTLEAHGTPTAVTGFRDAVAAGMKGTTAESMFPVDRVFDDAACMKFVATMFEASPAAPLAVGATARGSATHEVSNHLLEFGVERKLTAATDDVATVESIFTWKPDAKATEGGAKADGGGASTANFSRKDGFVVSLKRRLDANRSTETVKGTSYVESTIERLPEPATKAPATK